jgi:hypothetical protein
MAHARVNITYMDEMDYQAEVERRRSRVKTEQQP